MIFISLGLLIFILCIHSSLENQSVVTSVVTSSSKTNAYEAVTPFRPGQYFPWTDAQNLSCSVSGGATVSLSRGDRTSFIQITKWGLSIPSTAHIQSIQFNLLRSATSDGISDYKVALLRPGSNITNPDVNTIPSSQYYPTIPANMTYPQPGNDTLWGNMWSPTDLNSNSFGVSIEVMSDAGDDLFAVELYLECLVFNITYVQCPSDCNFPYGNCNITTTNCDCKFGWSGVDCTIQNPCEGVVCNSQYLCKNPGQCSNSTGMCVYGNKPSSTSCNYQNVTLDICFTGHCEVGECHPPTEGVSSCSNSTLSGSVAELSSSSHKSWITPARAIIVAVVIVAAILIAVAAFMILRSRRIQKTKSGEEELIETPTQPQEVDG